MYGGRREEYRMQMDGRLNRILSVLSEDLYINMETVADQLEVSERTARTLVSQLDELLCRNGAAIERRRGLGLRLCVKEPERYQEFIKGRTSALLPETGKERIEFILARLFADASGVKAEELCERLYISRKTLSLDLKGVEQYLNKHHLALERKPYYGLKIQGDEFSIRLCMSAAFYEFSDQWFKEIYHTFWDGEQIRNEILSSVKQCGETIYEMDIPNIVLQVQIALYRWGRGCVIPLEEMKHSDLLHEGDIRAARLCAEGLKEAFGICLPVPEIKYMAIQLLGKKKILAGDRSSVFIDMEINQLVNRMLESVKQTYNLDLASDFDLNTSLRLHMVSLRIRLQYRLKMDNPILKEIKEVYSFPYAVAAHASTVLSEYFHTIVPEAEIGYLALCFALSLKRQDRQRYKRNILLVCASGSGSAKLFEYRFREMFGDYLDRVEACDIGSLASWDFSNIDYVFSTVPVKTAIPVPVCQVQYFFDRHNAGEVERLLKSSRKGGIRSYFDRSLFFTNIKGNSREEILHELCGRIRRVRELPPDFEDSVRKRENLMQTDFCPQIAIPHPYQPVTKDTFVCVALLEKPVLWHIYEVQVVFLLSVSVNKENLEEFYRIAPSFMMDEGCMNHLLETRSYDTLMDIIDWAERDELQNR